MKASTLTVLAYVCAEHHTRLGDLLHFEQTFLSLCNNYFAQIAHILGNFCEHV